MKHLWIITLFVWCVFSTHYSHAQTCDAPKASETVRIYFGNGILNSSGDMVEGRNAIRDLIGVSSKHDYGLAENYSKGPIKDILYAFRQKFLETPEQFWLWIDGVEDPDQQFKDLYAKLIQRISSEEYLSDADLSEMIANYVRDLKSGKKVVIVAHSQGALYANSALRYIFSRYPEYVHSIAVVPVGSPGSYILGDNRIHVTNTLDRVIQWVRDAYYNGLITYPPLLANRSYDTPWDPINHTFVNTYIKGLGGHVKFATLNTIDILQTPEKDLECEDADDVLVDIDTKSASHITSTSAHMNGYVRSGKNIDVWTLYRRNNSSVGRCADYASSRDGVGPFSTGDTPYYSATGLTPDSTYYYRKCAKGTNNRVNESFVTSFRTVDSYVSVDVDTGGNSSIDEDSARLYGSIKKGSADSVWFSVKKSSSGYPYCSSKTVSVPGSYHAGSTFSGVVTGLETYREYRYRACGVDWKGNVSSGAISSFRTKAQACGSTYEASGGSEGMSAIYSMGKNAGTVSVTFEPYSIPDKMVITEYGTAFPKILLQTNGYVSGTQRGSFYFSNYINPLIEVNVYGNSDTNTRWDITVSCPGGTAYAASEQAEEDAESEEPNTMVTIAPPSGVEGVASPLPLDSTKQ